MSDLLLSKLLISNCICKTHSWSDKSCELTAGVVSFLSEVRECLKLDPDHKQCFSHYKQVKKLNKQIMSAEELIQQQRWVQPTSSNDTLI